MRQSGTLPSSARFGVSCCASILLKIRRISMHARRSSFIKPWLGGTVLSETRAIPIGKVWPTVWTRRPMAHSSAMLPRKPAAVVFDMDGLLFDTETLSQKAIVLAAAEGGHDVAPDVFTRTIGLPWAPCRALLLSHFGESFPVDQFREAWVRHFWIIAETGLELKPGALELLDTLDEFRIPRAIATSSFRRTVERHLSAHNLMGRFDEIVGHGD